MSRGAGAKVLPARSSRGARIHKLLGEEAEADEAFWNQDAWREEEEDEDYSTEDEEEDVVDSDFDQDEDPDDEVHDADEDEDGAAVRRQRRRQQPTGRRSGELLRPPRAPAAKRPKLADVSGSASSVTTYVAPKLRQSTARKSSESSELRRKILEEAARLAEKARKVAVPRIRLTQEQLLVEAVRTEVENVQSLNRLEQLEEERRSENALVPKAPFTGQMVRYHSRLGKPKTITFLNTDAFPPIFDQVQPTKRERPMIEVLDEDEDEEDPVDDDDDSAGDADDGDEDEEDDDDKERQEDEEGATNKR